MKDKVAFAGHLIPVFRRLLVKLKIHRKARNSAVWKLLWNIKFNLK